MTQDEEIELTREEIRAGLRKYMTRMDRQLAKPVANLAGTRLVYKIRNQVWFTPEDRKLLTKFISYASAAVSLRTDAVLEEERVGER